MISGWFVFAVVACITLCTGCILAVALLRAAWTQREREALTSTDLRALEESAMMLIEQLRSEMDIGIEEVESSSRVLARLIEQADERISAIRGLKGVPLAVTPMSSAEAGTPHQPADGRAQQVLAMAASGMATDEIARASGIGAAEVKLMLRLLD